MTRRTREEIDDQMNIAADRMDAGTSEAPSMSYEEGVHQALLWVRGDSNERPLDPDGVS